MYNQTLHCLWDWKFATLEVWIVLILTCSRSALHHQHWAITKEIIVFRVTATNHLLFHAICAGASFANQTPMQELLDHYSNINCGFSSAVQA